MIYVYMYVYFVGSTSSRLSKEISALPKPRDAHGAKEATEPVRRSQPGCDAASLQWYVDDAISDQLPCCSEAEFPTSVPAYADYESIGCWIWA